MYTMKRSRLIPLVILISVIFNIGFATLASNNVDGLDWIFGELGPALLQDSYYSRAPGLETLFGIIGDVPGGYSLYSGSPLQSSDTNATSALPYLAQPWPTFGTGPDASILILSVLFALVPLVSIIVIGRRSYGSTKTR